MSERATSPEQSGDPVGGRGPTLTAVERPLHWRRWVQAGVLAIGLVFLVVLPSFASGYWIRVLSGVFMFAALALSLNVIVGFTGLADFGNVVYLGMGGYVTALLMTNAGWHLAPAALAGAAFSALFAAVVGLPILRLKGHYFAIATIGLLEFTREMVVNLRFTGGGMGLSLPLLRVPPDQFNRLMYFIMLGFMVAYALFTWWVLNSRIGYALRAIKADPQIAAATGVDATRYRVFAWSTSAFLTGLVGGVYAFWLSYIEPPQVFNVLVSVKYWIMMLLGGAGTILGPIAGAFVLETISVTVWGRYLEWHLGVLGALMMLIVVFVPNGFAELVSGRFSLAAVLDNVRRNKI